MPRPRGRASFVPAAVCGMDAGWGRYIFAAGRRAAGGMDSQMDDDRNVAVLPAQPEAPKAGRSTTTKGIASVRAVCVCLGGEMGQRRVCERVKIKDCGMRMSVGWRADAKARSIAVNINAQAGCGCHSTVRADRLRRRATLGVAQSIVPADPKLRRVPFVRDRRSSSGGGWDGLDGMGWISALCQSRRGGVVVKHDLIGGLGSSVTERNRKPLRRAPHVPCRLGVEAIAVG